MTIPRNSTIPPLSIGGVPQGLTLTSLTFLPIVVAAGLAPALPTMLAHFADTPYAATLVPLLVTIPSLAVALLSPLAGRMAERYGRRKPLLISIVICGTCGFAPFFLESLSAILATRLLLGIAEAFVMTITNALYADYFTVDRRRYWLTAYGFVAPFFAASAMAASGALTSFRWDGAFLLYPIVIAGIGLAVYLYCFEAAMPRTEHSLYVGSDGAAVPVSRFPTVTVAFLCVVAVLTMSLFHLPNVQGAFVFRALGVSSPSEIGLYMGLSTLSTPVGALMFYFCSKYLCGERLIALLVAIISVSLIGMGLSPDPRTAFVFSVLEHVGGGMTLASLVLWSSTVLDPAHRTRGLGFFTSALFVGQFLVPLNFALAESVTGGVLPSFVLIGAIGLVFGAALMFVRVAPRSRMIEAVAASN